MGWVANASAYALSLSIAVILAMGTVWPRISLWGLRVIIVPEKDRCHEGQPVALTIHLKNKLPVPLFQLQFAVKEQPVAFIANVKPLERRSWEIQFYPEHRGLYHSNAFTLHCDYPFGVAKARKRIRLSQPLIVWPALRPLQIPLSTVACPIGRAGRNPMNLGTSGLPVGVREYRMGDSIRHIHWAQSVRNDQLMVREYDVPGQLGIELLIDTDPSIHADVEGEFSLEACLRLGAGLVDLWLQKGIQVRISGMRSPEKRREKSSTRRMIMDYFATIQCAAVPLIDVSRQRLSRASNSRMVFITTDRRVFSAEGQGHFDPAVKCILKTDERSGPDGAADVADGWPSWWEIEASSIGSSRERAVV